MAFGIPSEDFHGGFELPPQEEKVKYTNIKTTEEECLNELKNVGLVLDEEGPTLRQKVEEINSKFTRSFAGIGIDIEGKDLFEIMTEMADKINQLQIALDQVKSYLGMEMLFV